MNSTEIQHTLASIGGRANKKLGQHFLIDMTVLQTIVDAADIRADDHVLEVGPGLGVLSKALIDRGAKVTAIEQDRRFIDYLAGAPGCSTARVIYGDAARIDWTSLVGQNPWKFVSNLPYSITSLALRKALWSPNPPSKLVVLIQREVAERVIAEDGKTSLLSLMVALASSSARIEKIVPADAFYPPPQVESAVLSIDPLTIADRQKKWGIDPERVMSVAKRGFAHPRKFLASNLGLADPSVLESIGLDRRVRAEDLSVEQWVALAKTEV